jgi:hypothetical protein
MEQSAEHTSVCKYERLLERNREYRQKNKEQISAQRKEYYLKNREKLKKQRIDRYYESEATKLKSMVKCDICDCEIQKAQIRRHQKTKRHLAREEIREAT